MVEIQIHYDGQLRCLSQHVPSSTRLETDAPVDNRGRGESYSPTDLVATALGTCMATLMGIAADQRGLDLVGMRLVVEKEMSPDLPRRIARLKVQVEMPLSEEHPDREALIQAALTCPVKYSIHPEIVVEITWNWAK